MSEIVPLWTCNRREVYAVSGEPGGASEAVAKVIAATTGADAATLTSAIYVHQDEQAVRHLFRVASSLDSMVVGETEIQGQVRRAQELAGAEGASGPLLDRLFRRAIQAGRRVRRETGIGAGRVSTPSVAVGLAEQTVGRLPGLRVLILGAGQMAGVIADALAHRRVTEVVIMSRRSAGAASLAAPRGWRSATLDALRGELSSADVVFSATTAVDRLVTRDDVEWAIARRPRRPLVLVDLAVPSDIDPDAGTVDAVTLHTMEDIRRMALAGSEERLAQAKLAEALVAEEVERLGSWRPTDPVFAPTPVWRPQAASGRMSLS